MRIRLERNDDASAPVFLQSRFWADFKAESGWSYARYDVEVASDGDGGAIERFPLSVLERGLGLGFRFAYVPHGPCADVGEAVRSEFLVALAESLRSYVSGSCLFIRFDPAWYYAEPAPSSETEAAPGLVAGAAAEADGTPASAAESASAAGAPGEAPARPVFRAPLVKSSDVQPADSVVLDISRPDAEILSGMKSKWRYNVKLAEKKGVAVASEGVGALDEFYALYEATAARDRIAIHPKSYYGRLLGQRPQNDSEPVPELRLWMARYQGKALAGIISVYYGMEAAYLYGASSDEHRNMMPAYALQWAAIRAAREAGCKTYDFYGIPPVDDPAHPMSGLYRFKTGFGGEIRHYAGAWDYVLRPAAYAAFRGAERARLYWHKVIRKRAR